MQKLPKFNIIYKDQVKNKNEEYISQIQLEVKDKIFHKLTKNDKDDSFYVYNNVQSYFNKYFYNLKLMD